MSIVRAKKDKNFTAIDNALLNDIRLSWRARGIAAYLLSKPDDWNINSDNIWENGTEGRDAVRNAMKELEEAGYLHRQKRQDESGKWSTELVLTEAPTPDYQYKKQPTTENQSSVNQSSVFQALYKVLRPNTDTKTNDDDKEPAKPVDESRKVDTKILSDTLQKAGVGLSPIIFEQYEELLTDHGIHAVVSGIQAAAENGKQHLFKYVRTCIINKAQGNAPTYKGANNGTAERATGTGYSGNPKQPAINPATAAKLDEYREKYSRYQ